MLNFLNTYVQSRENPPRHVIVYTASHDARFFTALNARVVEASKSKHHSATLLTFWATIVIEAVLATKDQPCSVRRAVQVQSLEDLSTRIISSVSNGLILEKVPDLQVGCYMILMVLVTICPLKDNVLIALLERVTQHWATTQGPGLVCAAALAQHMNIISLSKPTLKSLLDIQDLTGELRRLKARYQVGNITLGILLGIAQDKKSQSVQRIGLAYSLIETGLLSSRHLSEAITAFLSASRDQHEDGNVALSIKKLLLHFAGEKSMKVVSQDVRKELDMEMIRPETKQPIHIPMASSLSHVSSGKSHSEDIRSLSASKSFDCVLSQIATESRNAISFFSYSSSNVFKTLGIAFELNSTSSEKLKSGSEMAMLFKSIEKAQPSFLSFFMRFWCSSYTANSRATAINLVSRYIKMQKKTLDIQLILPYALYGLADSSLNVRRASVNLINLFNIIYEMDEDRELSNRDNTFREQIYGQIKSNNDTMWVSTEDAYRFIRGILLPSLQDCLLDFHHIEQWLPNSLNMSKHSRSFQSRLPEFRKRFRQGIFTFLCSHAVNTPLYTVRHCLLRILNQIERVGTLSRTKLLLPLLIECDRQGQSKFEKQCNEEKVDPLQLLDLIVEIVLPTDIDGIKLLQRLLESKKWNDAPLLLNAIHKRIRHIWFKMKSDSQLSLANVLLKLAISDQDAGQGQTYNGESLNTLQSVQLSTTILQSFLESFSAFAINQERIFISKRRRTSNGHVAVVSPEAPIISELPIIRLSVILDLIAISKVERHPQLLKGLFQVLEDLQVYQSSFDTEMGYLQMNVMENILAIVKKAEVYSIQRVFRYEDLALNDM